MVFALDDPNPVLGSFVIFVSVVICSVMFCSMSLCPFFPQQPRLQEHDTRDNLLAVCVLGA